jgi:hypothetical protein
VPSGTRKSVAAPWQSQTDEDGVEAADLALQAATSTSLFAAAGFTSFTRLHASPV